MFYIQMPINFHIKSVLKTTLSPLTHIILMNRLLIEAVAQRCSVGVQLYEKRDSDTGVFL